MNVTLRGRTQHFRTVTFDTASNEVVLIEQRLLPQADCMLERFLLLLLLGKAPLKYTGLSLKIADFPLECQVPDGWLSPTGNEAAPHHIAIRRQQYKLRETLTELNCALKVRGDKCCGKLG